MRSNFGSRKSTAHTPPSARFDGARIRYIPITQRRDRTTETASHPWRRLSVFLGFVRRIRRGRCALSVAGDSAGPCHGRQVVTRS